MTIKGLKKFPHPTGEETRTKLQGRLTSDGGSWGACSPSSYRGGTSSVIRRKEYRACDDQEKQKKKGSGGIYAPPTLPDGQPGIQGTHPERGLVVSSGAEKKAGAPDGPHPEHPRGPKGSHLHTLLHIRAQNGVTQTPEINPGTGRLRLPGSHPSGWSGKKLLPVHPFIQVEVHG